MKIIEFQKFFKNISFKRVFLLFAFRSDAQRAAKQKEAKERELEHAAFSADRIEEGGFPVSMVKKSFLLKKDI